MAWLNKYQGRTEAETAATAAWSSSCSRTTTTAQICDCAQLLLLLSSFKNVGEGWEAFFCSSQEIQISGQPQQNNGTLRHNMKDRVAEGIIGKPAASSIIETVANVVRTHSWYKIYF